MSKAQDQLGSLRIAKPCQAAWEGMAGDERVRHCTLCSLNVYNFAEMTRADVRELLVRTEGRVCARLYRRADGTVLTRDCPTGLRAMRQRASRAAAALVAALCTLPAFALAARTTEKPRLKIHGSKVKLEVERIATPQPAVFTGVVDIGGETFAGVTVTVRDEASKRELTTITDRKGAFKISSLDDGLYRVEVTLAGLASATMEHLQLRASEVTHANIALRSDLMTVTLGGISVEPVTMDATSTTFSQQIIKKLPF